MYVKKMTNPSFKRIIHLHPTVSLNFVIPLNLWYEQMHIKYLPVFCYTNVITAGQDSNNWELNYNDF